jgi:hypothetical protein
MEAAFLYCIEGISASRCWILPLLCLCFGVVAVCEFRMLVKGLIEPQMDANGRK